ncbi:MAG: methyltransferase domain-containing protein [Anaerolineales bacterium]|nr:methyltransferase domain-containing protein [Anaerolineales bacterium]MCB9129151.1 methyltransferase domain-containing protein [Ardenticatenales bacterium]
MTSQALPAMYDELAAWWPLLSAVEEYAEEASQYRDLLLGATSPPPRTLLELGSGGGNNAFHLKAEFEMTLVDLSPAMVAVSQRLNPELPHHVADMRTVRLGQQFDAVFIHDAISYMTDETMLRQAMESAFLHCRPGGVLLIAPDDLRDTWQPSTSHGGHDGDGRALRYLAWEWMAEAEGVTIVTDYCYLLREGDRVQTVHDRHISGLFRRETWLRLLEAVGFRASHHSYEHSELPGRSLPIFVGIRPEREAPSATPR